MDSSKHRVAFPCKAPDLETMLVEIFEIRKDVLKYGKLIRNYSAIHSFHIKSAINLLQYLAFRLHDIRPVQYKLTSWGLSSFGRTERKVQATIDTVIAVIHELLGKPWFIDEQPPVCFQEARKKLIVNTIALFGETPEARRARIMVTMPGEASEDIQLILDLLEKGMNVARINCAHDNSAVWKKIIENIQEAEKLSGKTCKIHMDLGGPKLRTSEIIPGAEIIKVRPVRNESGIVVQPAIIRLIGNENRKTPLEDIPSLPVDPDFISMLKKGDTIHFKDARNSKRKLIVTDISENGVKAELFKTAYFLSGQSLTIKRDNKKISGLEGKIGHLPAMENWIELSEGDRLIVDKTTNLGKPAIINSEGVLVMPAIIGCTIPEVLDDVQPGGSIWFDDGKLGGTIESINENSISVLITYAQNGKVKLKKEKGINLPDTPLHLSAMTDQDMEDLAFVMEYADTVGLSFANEAQDVSDLISEMRKWDKELPGIIIKIETERGFNNLPDMLLAAMQVPKFGVMIARGDLAIECGFGRLAEIQEEILWICEAAHAPVIWATQVLEGLSKRGEKTRSEFTDAAMGQRAECIMLNKGDHIVMATHTLDDILRRMQDHQTKKRSTHRKLQLAEQFYARIYSAGKEKAF